MDFVVGIEIRLSNNHPVEDIYDELAGRYPKDFKFTGWHPFCRCQAVAVLKSQEGMNKDAQRILDGEEPLAGSVNEVTDVPPAFTAWTTDNAERIKVAEARGTTPYFIKDNGKYIDSNRKPRKATANADLMSSPRPKTPLLRATERHARRTAEEEQKIRERWDLRKEANRLRSSGQYTGVRVNYDNGGLMATHIGHNFDKKKGWYEKRVQEIGFENGNKVILENERDGEFYQKFTEGKWDDRPFEIATRETGTANNIMRGLKHCADKPNVEVAVLYFPKGFNKDNLANALYRYKSFERHPERTFVKFKRVVCITDEGIVYDQPL